EAAGPQFGRSIERIVPAGKLRAIELQMVADPADEGRRIAKFDPGFGDISGHVNSPCVCVRDTAGKSLGSFRIDRTVRLRPSRPRCRPSGGAGGPFRAHLPRLSPAPWDRARPWRG